MNGIFRNLSCSFLNVMLGAFLLISCEQQGEETMVTHFPFRTAPEQRWQLVSADGTPCDSSLFESTPSVVVNRYFSLPDTCGRSRLYRIEEDGRLVRVGRDTYSQLGYFFGERTIAQKEPGASFGIVDKEGRYVGELDETDENPIESVHNFSEGLALVRFQNGRYSYVDEHGKMVIPPLYDYASDFSGGVALVGVSDNEQRMVYQILNRKGEVQAPVLLQQCNLAGGFEHGVLAYKDRLSGRCALLDGKGKTIVIFPRQVKEILPSAWKVTLFLSEKGVGLADEEGNIVIPGSYEQGKILGTDRVAFRLHGKWGMTDFGGKVLLGFTYDALSVLYNDRFLWGYKDGFYRKIGRDGKPDDSEIYPEVLTDRIADRRIPQVFYRNPKAGKSSGENALMADSSAIEETFPEMENLSVKEPDVQSVSRENPFFEEAQKIYAGKLDEPDARRRKVILDYVERFRAAYTQKDLPFIEQVFSEDALIVVGKVVKVQRQVEGNYLSGPEVQYNVKSKKEYLSRLKEVFLANRTIQVRFSDFKIMRHPTRENFYGVTMRQGYASDIYSDDGYLFLLWDFSDEEAPKIHVRTWQPSMLDAQTPLPIEKVFSIRDFNFE